MAGGSMERARFFNLSEQPASICDVAHRRRFAANHRGRTNEQNRNIGIIVQKCFRHGSICPPPTLPRLGLQNTNRTTQPPSPLPRGPARRITLHSLDRANFHCQTRAMAALDDRESVPKDTKPKGFVP
jgi:hypothetical protein